MKLNKNKRRNRIFSGNIENKKESKKVVKEHEMDFVIAVTWVIGQ